MYNGGRWPERPERKEGRLMEEDGEKRPRRKREGRRGIYEDLR